MLMGHEIYAGFAKRLITICEDKGLPERGRQAALARLCVIKPSSVNKWFSAISLPSAENLLTIATWGSTTVDWLLDGRGKKNLNEYKAHNERPMNAAAQIADVPQGAPIESVLGHGLQWINSEEYKLLTLYRGTDDEGRDKIMRTADVVPKILLAGLTYHKA